MIRVSHLMSWGQQLTTSAIFLTYPTYCKIITLYSYTSFIRFVYANHFLPLPFPILSHTFLSFQFLDICGLTSGTTVYTLLTLEPMMWNISRGLFRKNHAMERVSGSLKYTDTTLPWTWNVKQQIITRQNEKGSCLAKTIFISCISYL